MTSPGLEPKSPQSGSDEGTSAVQPRTTTTDGLPTSAALKAEHQAWADEQATTSMCAFCDWTFTGTAADGRDKARDHRQKKHPEACVIKPRLRRRTISKRALRSAAEEEQITVDTAEARRLRAQRDEDQVLAKIERGRERARAAAAALDVAAAEV